MSDYTVTYGTVHSETHIFAVISRFRWTAAVTRHVFYALNTPKMLASVLFNTFNKPTLFIQKLTWHTRKRNRITPYC